ncbi:MAG: type 1 glutamine amidotransferase domain-containing protein [Fidelibacterota bacterium]
MKKIAVIIDDMFEDIEYTAPVEAYKKAGHSVINIGLETGKIVTGKKNNTPVTVDKSIDNVSAEDFDALLIPGGYSPDRLRAHEKPVKFVRDFVNSGKPVFLICHAAQLPITADVLKGRTLTGYKSIIQDIKNAGANFVDKEVVVDDNLVSSRHPGDMDAFIEKSLEKLN